MRIDLYPIGSHGDVHPFVGLGLALKARGHQVTLITNAHFAALAEQVGLDFVPLGTEQDLHNVMENPDLWHPVKGFRLVTSEISRLTRPLYDLIAERCATGATVVAAPILAVGARIAQDKLGIPMVSVHLQPGVFRSAIEMPVWPLYHALEHLPVWGRRLVFRMADAVMLDPLLAPPINAVRAELRLPRARHILRWWNSPLCNLCLFPAWYGPPQPDWPAPNLSLTGFPLFDEGGVQHLDADLASFLDAGPPPLVFTAGSAMMHGKDFFQTAVEACEILGRRGLLLARFADQVPVTLPASIRHVSYVPFSQVLPRSAAIVHHGGMGTIAQAFRAGIPQLVMPMAHDQPDNAARLERLGVGRGLAPRHFNGKAVARILGELLGSSEVAGKCREIAGWMRHGNPLEDACRVIEAVGTAAFRPEVTASPG